MAEEKKPETQTFETKLERLEALADKLQSPDLPLNDSMALFSEGVRLIGELSGELDKAEQKVKILTEKNGKTTLEDFEA